MKLKPLPKTLCAIALTFAMSQASAAGLKEIYELAVNNDPQLAIAEASYLARKEIVTQSRAGLLPFASVGASTTYTDRNVAGAPSASGKFNSHGLQASITQPLFQWERWFQFRQSKNIEAQAAAQFAADQQALIVRAADIYFGILEAQDRLVSSNAERDAVQRQLEQVQQRFDVGLVAVTDVLESTAAFDSSTVNVIEAEGAQATSFENLHRLTGQIMRQVHGLSDQFPVEYPEPRDEEAWVEKAMEGNLSLKAARENVKAAQQQLQVARGGHMPSVDAQVTYQESVTGGANFLGSESDQVAYTLRINVPIFAGGATQSKVREATYKLDESQSNLDLTHRTVVENTRTLYSAINTDVARVRARLRGIESSQSALNATQTGYEVGTRNIVDVLQAQQRLYLAQFQYATARYQYIKDLLRLKQIVGSLSPEDIYNLDKYVVQTKQVEKITPQTR